MNQNNPISGLTISLRPLQQSFFERYAQQFSLQVQKALHVDNVQEELTYLAQCLEQQERGMTFFYCIFDNITNDLIGALEIRNESCSRGKLYTWLNEQYWGKGILQEAISLAVPVYFAITGAVYFDAHVDVTNVRSYRGLKKSGFADLGFSDGPYGKQFVLVLRNKF